MISVIIPMYNSEKYIGRCLESVLNQTYQNFEIIIVNDGSTDSSLKVATEIQHKTDKISIINQKNQGPSNARNRGLEQAKGNYICFVDSDDYIDTDYLELLRMALIDDDVELSIVKMKNSTKTEYKTNERNISINIEDCGIISKSKYLFYMSQAFYNVFYGSQCNKIYVLEIIRKNKIFFDTSISLAEDLMFNLEYLKHVNRIKIIDYYGYYYNQNNPDSLTKTEDVWYLWDMARARYHYCTNSYKSMGEYRICEKNIDTALAVELIAPTYYVVKENYKGFRVAKKQLKQLYEDRYIKKVLKNNTKNNMVHRIAKFSLIIHSYSCFVLLMRLWIKIQRYDNNNS